MEKEKTSQQPKQMRGLLDDTPIKLSRSKSREERINDYIRQVNEPFERLNGIDQSLEKKKTKKK